MESALRREEKESHDEGSARDAQEGREEHGTLPHRQRQASFYSLDEQASSLGADRSGSMDGQTSLPSQAVVMCKAV